MGQTRDSLEGDGSNCLGHDSKGWNSGSHSGVTRREDDCGRWGSLNEQKVPTDLQASGSGQGLMPPWGHGRQGEVTILGRW